MSVTYELLVMCGLASEQNQQPQGLSFVWGRRRPLTNPLVLSGFCIGDVVSRHVWLPTLQVPRVMTVAGSDSGGGAGIQADLKTYQARGVFGTSAISALTAQNTQGVRGVHTVPTQHLTDQMEAVLSDIGADVVKTGMLPTAEVPSSSCSSSSLPCCICRPFCMCPTR